MRDGWPPQYVDVLLEPQYLFQEVLRGSTYLSLSLASSPYSPLLFTSTNMNISVPSLVAIPDLSSNCSDGHGNRGLRLKRQTAPSPDALLRPRYLSNDGDRTMEIKTYDVFSTFQLSSWKRKGHLTFHHIQAYKQAYDHRLRPDVTPSFLGLQGP